MCCLNSQQLFGFRPFFPLNFIIINILKTCKPKMASHCFNCVFVLKHFTFLFTEFPVTFLAFFLILIITSLKIYAHFIYSKAVIILSYSTDFFPQYIPFKYKLIIDFLLHHFLILAVNLCLFLTCR